MNDAASLAPELSGPLLVSLLAVGGLVISDARDWRPGRYFCKPIAALAFLWLAWNLYEGQAIYGCWILLGLALCMLGDLLLMPERDNFFLAGLLAFLLGHLFYAVAFLRLHDNIAALAAGSPLVLALLIGTSRWLAPHLDERMKMPVTLYTLVISGMLLCACLSVGHPAAWLIIPGALGFAVSDLAVARQQFVHREPRNAHWGTPLYFTSQMLLAGSIALS